MKILSLCLTVACSSLMSPTSCSLDCPVILAPLCSHTLCRFPLAWHLAARGCTSHQTALVGFQLPTTALPGHTSTAYGSLRHAFCHLEDMLQLLSTPIVCPNSSMHVCSGTWGRVVRRFCQRCVPVHLQAAHAAAGVHALPDQLEPQAPEAPSSCAQSQSHCCCLCSACWGSQIHAMQAS